MKHKALTLLSNVVIVAVIAALLAVTLLASGGEKAAFAPLRQGTDEGTAALTFNVYLGDEYVRAIMDVLGDYAVPATFFLGGSWVRRHADTCRLIVERGHAVGSHGYSHLDHSALSYGDNLKELNKAATAIREACGVQPTLFAPPSGAYGAAMLKACEDLGYTPVLWSKDTIDWRDDEVELLVRRATREMHAGDIVLMHPTAATVEALPRIIEAYLAAGYRLVTVAQMA